MARSRSTSTLVRSLALAGGTAVVVLGVAGPASAHVTITPSTTAAGGNAVLTLSVGHGCEGSSTTALTISIPEQVTSVTPTRNPQWEVEKQVDVLDTPVTDSHGNTVTERVSTVTYTTDTPLPDGYRDTFELSLQLPDAEGSVLAFPVIQGCQEGESAWIEVPAAGQDPEELELPAPAFTLTAAGADGHAATTSTASDLADAAAGDTPASVSAVEADGSTDVTGVVALVLAAVGIALGGVALARQRRRT